MEVEKTTLVEGLGFPECPRWHEEKLWFSDMYTKHVMTVDLEGNIESIAKLDGQPAGLGWLPDGRLLVVSMIDRRLFRVDTEGLTEIADLTDLASYDCNDMVVDSMGRAYIGNVGYDLFGEEDPKLAEIILVAPNGSMQIVADKLGHPNGCVITPDGQTMIVAETIAARLSAYDIDSDGLLANRRIWAQFDDLGILGGVDSLLKRVVPDGICLDAQGAVWIASPGKGGEVLRVQEGGKVINRIEVENEPYACMLGGLDRRTLFILTSKLAAPQGQGRIEYVRVEVPGAGLP
jgi:sugar lactone lactonase YvrE